MTDPELAVRIADLELKVHYLVTLVENLYQQLGVGLPAEGSPGAATGGVGQAGVAAAIAGPAADEQIRSALAHGELILAIKRYRELTGAGLKEAKDAVETMAGQ